MPQAMFDLPPTYACLRIRVEVPAGRRPPPMNSAERRMIMEVKAWERRERIPTIPPEQQRGLPGFPGSSSGLQSAGVSRVLTSRNVMPLNDFEKRIFGQVKPVEDKMLLDSQGVQRGIQRGTEKALNEAGAMLGTEEDSERLFNHWEDHGDWLARMKREGKL